MNWQWRRCCACKPRSFWRSCALWKSFQKHVYAFENKLMMMSLSSWQTTLTFILTLLCLSMLLKLNWLRSRSRPCDDDAAVVLAHYVYIHADAVIVLAQLCLYSCWCRHDCDCLVLSCRCWCQLKNVQYLFVRRVCDSSLREPHQCKNMIEETTHYFPLEHEIVLLLLLKQKDLVTQATATSPCLRNEVSENSVAFADLFHYGTMETLSPITNIMLAPPGSEPSGGRKFRQGSSPGSGWGRVRSFDGFASVVLLVHEQHKVGRVQCARFLPCQVQNSGTQQLTKTKQTTCVHG
jgi:hypothetical protein